MYMAHLANLPSELLIEIFKLATDNPVRDIDTLVSCIPFEALRSMDLSKQCKDTLRTKNALSLACSLFRRLSLELLYEDIWIRHGSDGLLEALESSKAEEEEEEESQLGLGGCVKRVSLSFVRDGKSYQSQRSIYENARRILLCCPNMRAFSRPQELAPEGEPQNDEGEVLSELPIDDLEFPSLHRVDWHNTLFDLPFASAPSPRFIWNSCSLRVLIVGADNFPARPRADDDDDDYGREPETVVIHLPNVHTLGIRSLNAFGGERERRRYSFALPALRRLVVGRPEAIYTFFAGFLAPLGPQITALEIESDPRFLRHDFVATLLGYCPNVTELYVPVATARPVGQRMSTRPRALFLEFVAMRRVYLHAAFCGSAGPAGNCGYGYGYDYDYKEMPWWTLLEGHFQGLCGKGSRLSGLERIVLCGAEWKDTIEDARFSSMLDLARVKGVRVECEEPELQRALFQMR